MSERGRGEVEGTKGPTDNGACSGAAGLRARLLEIISRRDGSSSITRPNEKPSVQAAL